MRGKHEQKNDMICIFFFFIQIIHCDLNASHTSQTDILEYLCCPYAHRHSMKSDSACRNMSCYQCGLKLCKDVCTDTTRYLLFFPPCKVNC